MRDNLTPPSNNLISSPLIIEVWKAVLSEAFLTRVETLYDEGRLSGRQNLVLLYRSESTFSLSESRTSLLAMPSVEHEDKVNVFVKREQSQLACYAECRKQRRSQNKANPTITPRHNTKSIDMNIAIVKYNAGNIYSVVNSLRRLGIEPTVTDNAEELMKADKVVFPGQGEASSAMAYLREHGLDNVIRSLRQPVLGICVGQQLLCQHSEEGDVDCIGIFPMDVRRFVPSRHEDKIPQMGWNSIYDLKSQLFKGIDGGNNAVGENDYVYFVHSYYVPLSPQYTIAKAEFILPYSAAIHKDNFYATYTRW